MDKELGAGQRRDACMACRWRTRDMYYRKGRTLDRRQRDPAQLDGAGDGDRAERPMKRGVVELGFLNMAEFAAGPTGHNVHHGHCRNPWDGLRVTGGSSSGWARRSPRAWSTARSAPIPVARYDCPAPACGVVGMKATYGRVISRAGAVARSWSLDHVGPLTRTVRDNAASWGAIAGHDPTIRRPARSRCRITKPLDRRRRAGLTIGLALPEALVPIDAQIGAAGAGRGRCAPADRAPRSCRPGCPISPTSTVRPRSS